MDTARDALPDDITALKVALASERAKALDIAAELAVALAKASEDSALIAQQKLQIAKLQRQIYGQRSERSSRLIDQLTLTFEELESSATEDELAAEKAVARTTTVRGFTRTRPERNTFPDHLPRERVVIDPPDGVRMLRRQSLAQARRRRDPDTGIGAASVEGDRDGARKVHLSGLRENQPSAGAVPCDCAGLGGTEPARDDSLREVRPASAI